MYSRESPDHGGGVLPLVDLLAGDVVPLALFADVLDVDGRLFQLFSVDVDRHIAGHVDLGRLHDEDGETGAGLVVGVVDGRVEKVLPELKQLQVAADESGFIFVPVFRGFLGQFVPFGNLLFIHTFIFATDHHKHVP